MSTIVYNMDCMEGMKQYPDNYFDLAIVDPPYGINVGSTPGGGIKPISHLAENQQQLAEQPSLAVKTMRVGGVYLPAQNIQGIR